MTEAPPKRGAGDSRDIALAGETSVPKAPTTQQAPAVIPGMVSRVKIGQLTDLAETRVRPTYKEHVECLAQDIDALPPVDVVDLGGGRFGILNGYHTRDAHLKRHKPTIRILVHDLPRDQWHVFAVRSNVKHGRPLSMDERRAAAKRMLRDNARRSDRSIAKDCGLTGPTVAKLRRQDDESGAKDMHLTRVGSDGKSYPVPSRSTAVEVWRDNPISELSPPVSRRDNDSPTRKATTTQTPAARPEAQSKTREARRYDDADYLRRSKQFKDKALNLARAAEGLLIAARRLPQEDRVSRNGNIFVTHGCGGIDDAERFIAKARSLLDGDIASEVETTE